MEKCIAMATVVLMAAALASPARADDAKSPLDFKMNDIKGKPVDLSSYKGKVVLMVNVASKCGNTPQYAGLERLSKKYKDKGLVVLGFPANEFGSQEPGSNAEISEFCTSKYGVDFDMFSKIVVKGDGIDPLYKYLTSAQTNPKFAGEISWNFEKFLVGRDGQIANRFKPRTDPESDDMVKAIEAELNKK